MKISQIDQDCFKISVSLKNNGKGEILIDPSEDLKSSKIKADIVILTENKEKTGGIPKDSFLIEGPGEYEIKGIAIRGIEAERAPEKKETQKSSLTIYTLRSEGIRACYLGNLGQKELNAEQLEKLSTVDVLLLPVTSFFTSKELQKIVYQIEPGVLIPVEKGGESSKTKFAEFLKEMGAKDIEKRTQIVLKKQELKEEGMEIIGLAMEQ